MRKVLFIILLNLLISNTISTTLHVINKTKDDIELTIGYGKPNFGSENDANIIVPSTNSSKVNCFLWTPPKEYSQATGELIQKTIYKINPGDCKWFPAEVEDTYIVITGTKKKPEIKCEKTKWPE